MRLFSTAALSLALAATAGLLMPASAMAQRNKKEDAKADAKAAEGAKLTLSQPYIKAISPVQEALKANKTAEAKPLLDAAAAVATSVDDDYHYGLIQLQYSNATKDKAVQKAALERLVKNERTPVKDRGSFAQVLGQTYLVEDQNYPEAQRMLQIAIDNGGINAATYYQLAETKFAMAVNNSGGSSINEANKPLAQQGLVDLEKATTLAMPDGAAAPVAFYDRGFKIARAASPQTVLAWGQKLLKVAPTVQNWKVVLFTVYDSHRDIGRPEALDLFRLMMEANTFTDANEYDAYAEIAWKMGLPGEVVTLYTKGKARGIVKDMEARDLYKLASAAVAKDKSSLPSSTAAAAKAADGKSSSNTGNAYIGYDDYPKAVELFKQAQAKGGVDANELNTRLGIALAHSGDAAGAQAAFGEVKGPGLRREIADFWQLWLSAPKAS